jgi:hypothetical protein
LKKVDKYQFINQNAYGVNKKSQAEFSAWLYLLGELLSKDGAPFYFTFCSAA